MPRHPTDHALDSLTLVSVVKLKSTPKRVLRPARPCSHRVPDTFEPQPFTHSVWLIPYGPAKLASDTQVPTPAVRPQDSEWPSPFVTPMEKRHSASPTRSTTSLRFPNSIFGRVAQTQGRQTVSIPTIETPSCFLRTRGHDPSTPNVTCLPCGSRPAAHDLANPRIPAATPA